MVLVFTTNTPPIETFTSHPGPISTDWNCDPCDNFWQPPEDTVSQKIFRRWLKRYVMPAQTDISAGAPFTTVTSVVLVCQNTVFCSEMLHDEENILLRRVTEIKWETFLMWPFHSCALTKWTPTFCLISHEYGFGFSKTSHHYRMVH